MQRTANLCPAHSRLSIQSKRDIYRVNLDTTKSLSINLILSLSKAYPGYEPVRRMSSTVTCWARILPHAWKSIESATVRCSAPIKIRSSVRCVPKILSTVISMRPNRGVWSWSSSAQIRISRLPTVRSTKRTSKISVKSLNCRNRTIRPPPKRLRTPQRLVRSINRQLPNRHLNRHLIWHLNRHLNRHFNPHLNQPPQHSMMILLVRPLKAGQSAVYQAPVRLTTQSPNPPPIRVRP